MSLGNDVLGLSFLMASLFCLGTWPSLLKLCSASPGNVYRRGVPCCTTVQSRDKRFVYMDYALAYFVVSTLPYLSSLLVANEDHGSEQSNENTTKNQLPSTPLIALAILGGSLLSLGNLSMQWATSVYGSALTTVLAIQASMTVVLGTSINFWIEPEKTARPKLLFVGIVLFLVAIGMATRAHLIYGQEKLERQQDYMEVELQIPSSDREAMNSRQASWDDAVSGIPMAGGELTGLHVAINEESATTDDPYTNKRLHLTALAIAIFGGLCFGFFSPAFNLAVNDPFDFTRGDPLSIVAANFWFGFAFVLASILGNIALLWHPPESSGMVRSSVSLYLRESISTRKLACVAGVVCGGGNLMQFHGGYRVGFATSDLVQAFPLVSTVWDVLLFGEFSKPSSAVIVALVVMYINYITAIALLALSIS